MPNPPPNRLVAAVVYDGLCSFEFGCAAEVFGLPRPEMGADWYRFLACAVEPGPLRTLGGLSLVADGGLDDLARAGTLILPGWRPDGPIPPGFLEALRAAHARGARLISICSGVFALAQAGLLDGLTVTTHWRHAARLAAAFPKVRVDANVLYVDNGQILTSAGSAAGLDLCLHVVRQDFGPKVANQVARRLVIAPHRDGGQAQFIEAPVPALADSRLAALIAALPLRLETDLTIAALARDAAMSPRSFIRRFKDATGAPPGEWIAAARVARARELLEATHLPLEAVAAAVGLSGAATLRQQFQRRVGLSPGAYRRRFSAQSGTQAPCIAGQT